MHGRDGALFLYWFTKQIDSEAMAHVKMPIQNGAEVDTMQV